jgi:tRNA G46 methylase TrmB
MLGGRPVVPFQTYTPSGKVKLMYICFSKPFFKKRIISVLA